MDRSFGGQAPQHKGHLNINSTPQHLNDSTLVLHTCCAVCAAACAERLRAEGLEPVLFFSNSNIAPKEEYDLRLDAARQLAAARDLELVEDGYDHEAWLNTIKGYEAEPEKGKRCELCFDFSFTRTAAYVREHGHQGFTSTLTVSPHKVSRMVFAAGKKYPEFRDYDFKKQDGFRRSQILSRELGLYHQHYCGCEFSLKEAKHKGRI